MGKRLSEMGGSPGFARGMTLAFEFVGALFLFWLVGRFLDDRFGTEPWLQVIGALVGWAGGFLHVYYRSKGEGWGDVPQTSNRRNDSGTGTDTGKRSAPQQGSIPSKDQATERDGTAGTGATQPPSAHEPTVDGDGIGGKG